MTHYVVTWQIDIETDTPEKAAQEALRIQRKYPSCATCFTVEEKDDPAWNKYIKPNIDLGWC